MTKEHETSIRTKADQIRVDMFETMRADLSASVQQSADELRKFMRTVVEDERSDGDEQVEQEEESYVISQINIPKEAMLLLEECVHMRIVPTIAEAASLLINIGLGAAKESLVAHAKQRFVLEKLRTDFIRSFYTEQL